jgi:type 1 glutamine amidotransferase
MHFGIDTFLFTSPFTNRSTRLFPQFKRRGFDSMEIAVEGPEATTGFPRPGSQLKIKFAHMKKYLLTLAMAVVGLTGSAADKKIIFIAGPPSHGPGQHEHRAGCLLLKSCLDRVPGVTSVVYSNGWPTDPKAFDDAAAIVVYSDGGAGHPLLQDDHLKIIGALMDRGVGLACLHYAVEPTIEKGQKEFLDWIGGAFEINWSVNPDWAAEFKTLPDHPIARGVQPFKIEDEWYFHMRFRDDMKGVTPLLMAVPGESTTKRNDGPHEGNPVVRELVARGEPQCVAWAAERAGGGRGFGFTGAHFHHNWGDDNFRKLVLNAILWTAKVEVPKTGVVSVITPEQLQANLDPKPGSK